MVLWNVSASLESYEYIDRLGGYDPAIADPKVVCLNEENIIKVARSIEEGEMVDHEIWQRYDIIFRSVPEPVMKITDEKFSLDYFFLLGYYFTSQKMQLALSPYQMSLFYRDVDTSSSLPAIRALEYRIVHVLPTANPFDPARMPGRVRPVRQEDGTLRDEWIVEPPLPKPDMVTEFWFRDDFVPPAPVFRAVGTHFTLATDEFADRVMRAGITDMAFSDISGRRQPGEMVYRRLR